MKRVQQFLINSPEPDPLNYFIGCEERPNCQEAKAEGISLNSYIVQLLSERHIAYNTEKKLEIIQNILFGFTMGQTKAESDMDTPHVLFEKFTFDDL